MNQTIKIATYNLSIAAVTRQPERVVADLQKLTSIYDVILIQEAGAAKGLFAKLFKVKKQSRALVERAVANTGWVLWAGTGVIGQASDPVIYSPELDVVARYAFPLTGRLYQGKKGAGFSAWSKPKFLMTLVVRFNGRTLNIGGMHATPSQYIPLRSRIARKQFEKAADWMSTLHGLKFIGGDLNQVAGHKNLWYFREIGLQSFQVLGGVKPTMGKRAIDDIYGLDAPLRYRLVKTQIHPGVSDHHAFGVDLSITERKIAPQV